MFLQEEVTRRHKCTALGMIHASIYMHFYLQLAGLNRLCAHSLITPVEAVKCSYGAPEPG